MSAGANGFSTAGQPERARTRPAAGPSVSPVTKAMQPASVGCSASSQANSDGPSRRDRAYGAQGNALAFVVGVRIPL